MGRDLAISPYRCYGTRSGDLAPELDLFELRRAQTIERIYRSAGACPPQSWHGEGQALALRCGVAFFVVARGPVPRDRGRARGTRSHARVACEGPRPTVTPRYARFETTPPGSPTLSELLSWCALDHHQRQIIILLRFTHKFVDILYDAVNYLLRRVICRHLGN